MLADIFITTKNRGVLLRHSLESLKKSLGLLRTDVRITLVRDGHFDETFISPYEVDYTLTSKENQGLGPSINMALAHIDALNKWYEHPTHGDPSQVAPFIAYCQDDLLYTPGWLTKLVSSFVANEKIYNLGFASGLECVEHKTVSKLGNALLKPWIRAAQMFARREYWMSMFPIPRFDPETGRVRAKPNDGWGSGVDWHFIRNHPNSIDKTGRTCLVIPGLVQHLGYNQSTWLDRELPESESDRRIIDEALGKCDLI